MTAWSQAVRPLLGATVTARDQLTAVAGGPARRRAILLLAAVMSLQSADGGTVGALAAQLERSFRIGNTKLGLLVTVTSLVGAVGSLPMGAAVDRVNRVRLLTVTIGAWTVAMVMTGFATSYLMLLLTRLALGAVMAVSGPAVASLAGDLFPAAERSRIYGFILTGDLLGSGAGLLVAGNLGASVGWRLAFFLLAVPSAVLAVVLSRMLPEPGRGGQSWLRVGDEEFHPATERDGATDGSSAAPADGAADEATGSALRRRVRRRHDVQVRPERVLRRDPLRLSLPAAARYILRIPSIQVLIGSSVLGYFFLAGLRTFAVLFAERHFGLSPGVVSLLVVVIGAGAIVGTLAGGRLADRMLARGRLDARLVVAGVAYLGAVVAFVPGLVSKTVAISLPAFVLAGGLLTAPNPPLDAARLDIVPSRLWGRAESVRTFTRTIFEAAAPLLFGYVSSLLGGAPASFGAGVNNKHAHLSATAANGLEYTFLIMLVPLAASGVLLLTRRRSYLGDVATADASERATGPPREEPATNG